MHRITIRISGGIQYEESIDMNESDALPLFMRLKEVIGKPEKSKKVTARTLKSETNIEPEAPALSENLE